MRRRNLPSSQIRRRAGRDNRPTSRSIELGHL